MILLGIDPGSVRIGFGAIKKERGKLLFLESGLLDMSIFSDKNLRLQKLENDLVNLLEKINPAVVGVEKLFFVKNQKTALEVAQSRGIIMNTIIKRSIPLVELSPSEIKLAVTGNGQASKKEIAKMLKYFLDLPKIKMIDDTTDALAIAITIANKNSLRN